MPIDPSIPLQVNTPNFGSNQGQFQAMQMAALLDDKKLRGLQMKDLESKINSQAALKEGLQGAVGPKGEIMPDKVMSAYTAAGDPMTGATWVQNYQKAEQESDVAALEYLDKSWTMKAKLLANSTDPISYKQNYQMGLEIFGPEMMEGVPEQYDPKYVQQALFETLDVKERIEVQLNERKFKHQQGVDKFDQTAKLTDQKIERQKLAKKDIPSGFRVSRNGGLEPIPGGPHDPKTITNKKVAELTAKEIADLDPQKVNQDADYLLGILDSIVTFDENGEVVSQHPGLKPVVGLPNPFTAWTPGTDAAGFRAYHDQVIGNQFMEAYKTLKGGGQITEVEGKKATQALARMSLAQSEEDYIQGVKEFREVVITARDRALERGDEIRGVNDPLGIL